MFPKDNVEPTKGLSWDEYYERVRKSTRILDSNMRQEQLQWAIMRLLFEILAELRKQG